MRWLKELTYSTLQILHLEWLFFKFMITIKTNWTILDIRKSPLWQLCAAMMSWVQQWVELVVTNRFRATRYMKVKKMGITEILRKIWLFSANKINSAESFSKQPTQLINELNSSLRRIIVTLYSTLYVSRLPGGTKGRCKHICKPTVHIGGF